MTKRSPPAGSSVGSWLASRTPPPPEPLRSRIVRALGVAIDDEVTGTDRVCLEAAERVLARLFREGRGDRHEAADLLAADALVTYALEFAADTPELFDDRATRAIVRLGRLHEAYG